jgi:hypothetical protein
VPFLSHCSQRGDTLSLSETFRLAQPTATVPLVLHGVDVLCVKLSYWREMQNAFPETTFELVVREPIDRFGKVNEATSSDFEAS